MDEDTKVLIRFLTEQLTQLVQDVHRIANILDEATQFTRPPTNRALRVRVQSLPEK